MIRFDSDDDLPLTIVIRSVLKNDNGFYPQIFLDRCVYEV